MNSETAKLLNKWAKLHGKQKNIVKAIFNKTPKDKRGGALNAIRMDISRTILQRKEGRDTIHGKDVRQIQINRGDVHISSDPIQH